MKLCYKFGVVQQTLLYLFVSLVLVFANLEIASAHFDAPAALASNAPVVAACPNAQVQPNVAAFIYCIAPNPNTPNSYTINMIISNQSSYDLDLSHTVLCVLQSGTNVNKITAPNNNVNVTTVSHTLTWTPSVIPAGQTRNISFDITKAVDSDMLIQSVKVTGINQVLNSPFTAILSEFKAETETRVTLLNVAGVTPTTPATGFAPALSASNFNWPLLLTLLGLSGASLGWLRKHSNRKMR